jgi:hypothetical protein
MEQTTARSHANYPVCWYYKAPHLSIHRGGENSILNFSPKKLKERGPSGRLGYDAVVFKVVITVSRERITSISMASESVRTQQQHKI